MDETLTPATPLPHPLDETPADAAADNPDSPDSSDAPPADDTPDSHAPDIDAMLAEAEQRGYLRGCNEQIESLMQQPDLWHDSPAAAPADDEPQILILNHIRPSVWDE